MMIEKNNGHCIWNGEDEKLCKALSERLGGARVEIVYSGISRYNLRFGDGVREEDVIPILEELGYRQSIMWI